MLGAAQTRQGSALDLPPFEKDGRKLSWRFAFRYRAAQPVTHNAGGGMKVLLVLFFQEKDTAAADMTMEKYFSSAEEPRLVRTMGH